MEEALCDLTGLRGDGDAGTREMVAFPAATDTRRQPAHAPPWALSLRPDAAQEIGAGLASSHEE